MINDTFATLEGTACVPLIRAKDDEKIIPEVFVNKIEELQQGMREMGR